MNLWIFLALMIIPWLATFLGSYLSLKIKIRNDKQQSVFLGFAAGIMISASIWSLILPAFEEAGSDLIGIALVSFGFILGCLGMLALDSILPHQHINEDLAEGRPSHLSRPMLLVLAVALHNIPEGISLGVIIAAASQPDSGISLTAAIMFGVGLALQNFPEGMAVTMPMMQAGIPYKKCRRFSVLASFAEPLAALIGFFATHVLSSIGRFTMPVLLAIAAGAMIFIVVEELIPESQSYYTGHAPTYGFLVGFWIMAAMGVWGA